MYVLVFCKELMKQLPLNMADLKINLKYDETADIGREEKAKKLFLLPILDSYWLGTWKLD